MSHNITMKELAQSERPYEKCEQKGAKSLSDAELLAVLLRTGTSGENVIKLSRRLLYTAGEKGLLGLHRFSMEQLKRIRGIGKVKAIQITCILELSRRLAKEKACETLNFACPSSIADYYMEDLRHKPQEQTKLLMLDSKSSLIAESDISIGTVNASLITPRELFIEALQKNAVSIILLHNHPSGDPVPSEEDFLVTQRIKSAGELIGIALLDHIIIGDKSYISFAEKGLLK